jgi:deoxyadenosine/deoxycytidine kinase
MIGCPALSAKELKLALANLRGRHTLRNRALVILGARTGLRISELLAIRVSRVWDGQKTVVRFYVARQNTRGKHAGASIVLHPRRGASRDPMNQGRRIDGKSWNIFVPQPETRGPAIWAEVGLADSPSRLPASRCYRQNFIGCFHPLNEVQNCFSPRLASHRRLVQSLDQTTCIMDNPYKVLPSEQKWFRFNSAPNTSLGAKPLITLCGPSGSGKTTITAKLLDSSEVYLENTSPNIYHKSLLGEDMAFDAVSSQRWFLEAMSNFISRCNPTRSLILDQDPAAIVLVYSRLFLEDGLFNEKTYEALVDSLIDIENDLRRWRRPRKVICLDAKEEVLRTRAALRLNSEITPSVAWFSRLRLRFNEVSHFFPETRLYDTEHIAPDSIAAEIRQIYLS